MKGRITYGIVILRVCIAKTYMKGRNTFGIVIIKSLYCLNVYERQKYIWYCNLNEFVLFKCI